jgi:hypothetical protein
VRVLCGRGPLSQAYPLQHVSAFSSRFAHRNTTNLTSRSIMSFRWILYFRSECVDKEIRTQSGPILGFLMDDEEQAHTLQLIVTRGLYNAVKSDQRTEIKLDLTFWHAILHDPVPPDNLQKVDKILQIFVDIGAANGLNGTVAVQKLQDAIFLIRNPPKKPPSRLQRMSHSETILRLPLVDSAHALLRSTEDASSALTKLLQLATYNVPLFNIWDSISLIYTLCVERTTSPIAAQLHIYQFRTAVSALASHPYFNSGNSSPTTVVATWAQTGNPIAFATSCSGKRTEKVAMARARLQFAKLFAEQLNVIQQKVGLLAKYSVANCGEYLAFIIVCRRIGEYSSLCLTIHHEYIYKICGYCEELRDTLANMGIRITDIWLDSSLGIGPGVTPEDKFPYRNLLTFEEIKCISS